MLDIGCGRGGLIELLHRKVALAAGVDPDLRSLIAHRQPALIRVAGMAEHLPFPDGHFDLIICSWVLEHLAQPQQAFGEIARVLRDPDLAADRSGGHFVFVSPNAWHPLTWVSRIFGRFGDWQARLGRQLYDRAPVDAFPLVYHSNTRHRMEQLALVAGLELAAFYTVGDPTYLAFNELFFRLATLAERWTPRWMKIHLVGDFVKRRCDDPS